MKSEPVGPNGIIFGEYLINEFEGKIKIGIERYNYIYDTFAISQDILLCQFDTEVSCPRCRSTC